MVLGRPPQGARPPAAASGLGAQGGGIGARQPNGSGRATTLVPIAVNNYARQDGDISTGFKSRTVNVFAAAGQPVDSIGSSIPLKFPFSATECSAIASS